MNFHKGDTVRVGKGKVEYTVWETQRDGQVTIQSNNTGKFSTYQPGKLILIEDVMLAQEEPVIDETAELVNLEHIPGETRREYFERTGQKLDGRITNYGRDILAALQLKKNVFTGKAVTNRTKGRTQQAKRTARLARKAGDR